MSNKPTHRVSFARFIGTDENADRDLGSAREIGAIWPKRSGKGGILRLDHIPIELTQHEGVIFITEIN